MNDAQLIGNGGREHAIAWKLAQSPQVGKVYVLPGNDGMTSDKIQAVLNTDTSVAGLQAHISCFGFDDLTIVGPEVPLSDGLVDQLKAVGIEAFGPTQAAARIESSKIWAKQFMRRHNIPTAPFEVFTSADDALKYLDSCDPASIVIKADGLAAGKGVVVPNNMDEARAAVKSMMIEHQFGASGNQILIEQRMTGEEISLLAFCDGKIAVPMPPAQDHKRAYDGDTGPNTGGMGAYAPVPFVSKADIEQYRKTILQPVIDGMQAEGHPYIGVLYAGLMLTPDGAKVVEYNCRFGDPETQVLMPLLETDLLDICTACINGTLADLPIRWHDRAAITVVMASGGYPGHYETGKPITGLDKLPDDVIVFHAGTKNNCTAGGRVLNVTATGATLTDAREKAYAAIQNIHFDGAFYRKDIGAKAHG